VVAGHLRRRITRTDQKDLRFVYKVERVGLANVEYDLINDPIIFPRLEQHKFMFAHLHVIPSAREEVVYCRGVWIVCIQAHRRGRMYAGGR
jgi:hypothetical protein